MEHVDVTAAAAVSMPCCWLHCLWPVPQAGVLVGLVSLWGQALWTEWPICPPTGSPIAWSALSANAISLRAPEGGEHKLCWLGQQALLWNSVEHLTGRNSIPVWYFTWKPFLSAFLSAAFDSLFFKSPNYPHLFTLVYSGNLVMLVFANILHPTFFFLVAWNRKQMW